MFDKDYCGHVLMCACLVNPPFIISGYGPDKREYCEWLFKKEVKAMLDKGELTPDQLHQQVDIAAI